MTLAGCVCLLAATLAAAPDIARYDPRMAVDGIVVTNGLKWIDGRLLPIEGRAFDDTEHYYDRLPAGVTTNVNGGVRAMKHHTPSQRLGHDVPGQCVWRGRKRGSRPAAPLISYTGGIS